MSADTLEQLEQEFAEPTELSEMEQQIHALAGQIKLWQDGQKPKLSDAKLIQRFPGLGSTKTFSKLRDADFSQLNIEDWLPKYRTVLIQIETEDMATSEVLFDELSAASEIYRTSLQLLHSRGLNRLLLIEGGSGNGKSTALDIVRRKLVGSVIVVEANESWRRPWVAVGTLCLAVGVAEDKLPSSLDGRITELVKQLQSKRIIFIDEAQHMSGETLNVLKTLINRTSCLFGIAALDTLWKKLQTNSWQEAKQLIFNRMYARIRLKGPTIEDVEYYFSHRLTCDQGKAMQGVYKQVTEVARDYGGYAFLRNTVDRVQDLGISTLDSGTLLEAARHVRAQVEGK